MSVPVAPKPGISGIFGRMESAPYSPSLFLFSFRRWWLSHRSPLICRGNSNQGSHIYHSECQGSVDILHRSQDSPGRLLKSVYGTMVAVVFVSTHVRFIVRSSNLLFASVKTRRISAQCCSFPFSTKVSIIARRLSNASVPSAVILSSPWRDLCIDAEQTSSILNRQRMLAGSNCCSLQ